MMTKATTANSHQPSTGGFFMRSPLPPAARYDGRMNDDDPYKPPETPPAQEGMSRMPEWVFDTATVGMVFVAALVLGVALAWGQFVHEKPVSPGAWWLILGVIGLGFFWGLIVYR